MHVEEKNPPPASGVESQIVYALDDFQYFEADSGTEEELMRGRLLNFRGENKRTL